MAVDWVTISSRLNCCKVAQGSGQIPKVSSDASQMGRFTVWEKALLLPTEHVDSAELTGCYEPVGVFLGHGAGAPCLKMWGGPPGSPRAPPPRPPPPLIFP